MLPHIETQDGPLAFHDGLVLIRCALDAQLPSGVDQPGPSAAEPADTRLRELFLEAVETAERRLDRVGKRTGRRPAGLRSHDLPEHGVIHVAAAIVPDGHPDVFR